MLSIPEKVGGPTPLDVRVALLRMNREISSSQADDFKKFCKDNKIFENYEVVYDHWENKEYDIAIVMGGL